MSSCKEKGCFYYEGTKKHANIEKVTSSRSIKKYLRDDSKEKNKPGGE